LGYVIFSKNTIRLSIIGLMEPELDQRCYSLKKHEPNSKEDKMKAPVYDPEAVRPMREQLEQVGLKSLADANEVDDQINNHNGVTLMVINSICGCAAGSARPGIMQALQHKTIPDNLATVFAGQDHEAVARVRALMTVPPSSPCVALFDKGKMIFALERHQIEGANQDEVAQALVGAFDKYCKAEGPSVTPEIYNKIEPVMKCGSNIPRYAG
jgi:putative YphP/YqiW family bacilliredoxin